MALIGATSTATGLRVHAEFDPAGYPTGVLVSDQVMDSLPITAHPWHGEWNYTLRPEPPAPLPEPRLTRREQPADRAPAWLHHPTLTFMTDAQYAGLLAQVEQYLLEHPPLSPSDRTACQRILRRGPLSLSDRLLITVLRQRWSTQVQTLTNLLATNQPAVSDAVHEITPILAALGHSTPKAPIKAPAATDLGRLVGRTDDQNPK